MKFFIKNFIPLLIYCFNLYFFLYKNSFSRQKFVIVIIIIYIYKKKKKRLKTSIFRNCVHIVSSILSRSTNQPINFAKFSKKNISSFQIRWRPFILILGTCFGQHLPVQLLETLIMLNYCPDDLK